MGYCKISSCAQFRAFRRERRTPLSSMPGRSRNRAQSSDRVISVTAGTMPSLSMNGKSAVPDPRMGERDRIVRVLREAKGR
jgi:hypothetical protein